MSAADDAEAALGLAASAAKALGQSGANSIPGIYNLDPTFLSKWRKAKARVRAGTGRAVLACVGDSTTRGSLGGTSNTDTNSVVGAYPARMAAMLNARGLVAHMDCWFGGSNYAAVANLTTADPRLTVGADWSLQPSFNTGGGALVASSGTTTFAFAPAGSFDTMVFYHALSPSHGSFTVNVDGGATLSTISNASGAVALGINTVTCTKGAHTINMARSSGGTVFVAGISAYDSTTPAVDVLNLGWGGSKATDWASTANAWGPQGLIGGIAPDLTLIDLGINDWMNGTSLASFAADIQTTITKAKQSGDVILLGPPPSNPGNASVATQATYLAQLRQLAVTNNCPMIDWTYRLQSWTAANALGMFADNLHPNALGYADMADIVATILLQA